MSDILWDGKRFRFSFEFMDGNCGEYIFANSRDEAEASFRERCQEKEMNPEQFMLVRIEEFDNKFPFWLWDLYRDGISFPSRESYPMLHLSRKKV